MVLVFVEHADAEVPEECLEAVTLARDIASAVGESLEGVVVGGGDDIAGTLGEYGVQKVTVVTNEELQPYAPAGWARALGELMAGHDAVIAAGTERSQEIVARLGAQRDIPVAANCNDVQVGDEYTVIRQRWGGSLLEEARLTGEPKLLTVTPHETSAGPATDPVEPDLEKVEVDVSEADLRVQITRIEEADIEGVPLGEARVVVGGGRGVGSADGFAQLEELADLLGGTVGSSRAAVNEGWRPHDDQIGLTGAKISPELYIPCGISGAVQHWVGAKGAKHILSINTDEEAAIVQKSDWTISGDLHEVVPAIVEEIRARR